MRPRQFSETEIQDIVSSYKRGENIGSISQRYGYAPGSGNIIRKVLLSQNVEPRRRLRKDTVKNGKKICRICKRWKNLSSFYKRTWKGKPSTEFSYCKECNKRANPHAYFWYIKNKYGLSKEEYTFLLEKQNFLCAICKCKPEDASVSKKKLKLVVDHDHSTNKIRGLLCDNCNKAIGQFKESIENIREAVKYLEING